MALFARLYPSLFAKPWRWIGLLVVVLGLVGWHFKHSAGPVDPIEKTATVAATHLVEVITATGLVVPRTSVQITCKASGMVLAVLVQPSSRVKKGDLLLEIDPQEEGRNRQRAEVALGRAQN